MTDSAYESLHLPEILDLFDEIHKKTIVFKFACGIRCLSDCGHCCDSQKIEATVPEFFPLAVKIYEEKREDEIISRIEERMQTEDKRCILYQPDPEVPGNGKCSEYEHRALLCRLFGFSARKNKVGNKEFCACRAVKKKQPELIKNADKYVAEGGEIPIYQEISLRWMSLFPTMGLETMPINEALLKALEIVWWKKPKTRKPRYAEAS